MTKRKSLKRVYLGDIIKTNETFKRENFLITKQHKGMVICFGKNQEYGIRFGQDLGFTTYLDGKTRNKNGCFLNRNEFDVCDSI
jgi:hypothetical protein